MRQGEDYHVTSRQFWKLSPVRAAPFHRALPINPTAFFAVGLTAKFGGEISYGVFNTHLRRRRRAVLASAQPPRILRRYLRHARRRPNQTRAHV